MSAAPFVGEAPGVSYAHLVGAFLLLASWGSALLLARRLLARADERGWGLALALALAMVAVVPGQLTRLTANLPLGMLLAALAFGAAVGALELWARRTRGIAAPPSSPRDATAAWPAWLLGGPTLFLVAHGAWFRNFFDDEHHVPMALVLARGVVPPEHPLLPGQVMPYHWGVDALYAQLVTAGLGIERAIDLVTLGSFALLLWTASTLGARMAGRVGATLYPMVVPLAGSVLAQPLHDDLGPLAVVSSYPPAWREWTKRPPPITADFFQHPQGLAMPLVLAVLALFAMEREESAARERLLRRGLGALLLGALSLVQAVHFVVLGFGLGASALWIFLRTRDARRLGVDLGMLALAAALAVLLGGFFSPGAGTGSTLVWGLDFFRAPTLGDSLARHLVFFGPPLFLLPLAALAGGRLRLALVLGACIGFALPSFVVYRHTWDIVKLYSAGGFLAGIALADTLSRGWQTRGFAGRALVVLVALATVEFPLAWLASRTALQGRAGVPKKADWRVRPELVELSRVLREQVPARDRVLVHEVDVARATGIFGPGFDARRFASGHIVDFSASRELAAARTQAFVDMGSASLDALRVRWVLLSDGELTQLGSAARAALDDSARFEVVARELPGRFTLWRRRGRRCRRSARAPRSARGWRGSPGHRCSGPPRRAWLSPR